MCLIVAKPKGTNLPRNKDLRRWFREHPDGFGLAYSLDGKVKILKGALEENEMFNLIAKMKRELGKTSPRDIDIILHFRQATGGTITPENCHPFPLTVDQKALAATEVETDCAVAHNGIIFGYAAYNVNMDKSWTFVDSSKTDTQEFIEDYLVDLGDSLWQPTVQRLIEAYTESRFALLTTKGITYIGEFIEEHGCFYSNGGFKDIKPVVVIKHPEVSLYGDVYYANYPEEYGEGCREEPNICPACTEVAEELYEIPDDYTPVCSSCFCRFVGREPSLEEKVFL